MLTIEHEGDLEGGHVVFRPAGNIDAFTVRHFRRALTDLPCVKRLVIDLSDVSSVDTAGLDALIGDIRGIREQGAAIAIACDQPSLVHLLYSVGFERLVTIAATTAEAAASLRVARTSTLSPIVVDRLDDDPPG